MARTCSAARRRKLRAPAPPGTTGTGSGVADWGACTGGLSCKTPGSVCVKHSNYYSQCKPATLPTGELCGQNDGTNVWKYDKCPSNQKCAALGTDFRCTNKKRHKKSAKKDESCTITNESQCDGQNWTFSTCCADPNYECRKSDDGQNVKRCQKIADGDYTDSEDSNSDDDYSHTDDDSYVDDIEYTSYVDDWGDCTSINVGCSNDELLRRPLGQLRPVQARDSSTGELCGQDDGTNVWWYPYCTSGERCEPKGRTTAAPRPRSATTTVASRRAYV
ncbi:hypothetical protein Pcac1_g14033 [Phytophthora cactorum]|nr:hypothetical protein Pcac1_g14033 [Phytophthora cactorum]